MASKAKRAPCTLIEVVAADRLWVSMSPCACCAFHTKLLCLMALAVV